MARYGKYATTKKVAMALQAMVRGQYAQDTLQMVGFYTLANVMNEQRLLDSAPKPVGLYDLGVHLEIEPRRPLAAAGPALHQHSRRAEARPDPSLPVRRGQQADHRHHRR